ncbi:hypothetical protein ACFYT3_31480 [Nocardia amikacinitolerans]|uniref:hypothetical protein n=1 Tax=Nocardia amikacinitolerans TaxID=756689 RepID=UPI003689A62A
MIKRSPWTGQDAVDLQEAMRLSIRSFSERLGVEQTTVSRWHSHPLSALRTRTQMKLDTALQTAPADVQQRFRQLQSSHQTPPGERRPDKVATTDSWDGRANASLGAGAATPHEVGFFDPHAGRSVNLEAMEEVDVRRQEFLRAAAALSVAAALPSRAREVAIESVRISAPERAGMEHVEQVRAWTAFFRQADDAGLNMIEGMAAQLRAARGFLDAQMPPHVARHLRTAVATFHRVVGWAHYDRGEHGAARDNFKTGLALIADNDAGWLRAAIHSCIARQSIYRYNPHDPATRLAIDDALDNLSIASFRTDKLSLLRRADLAAVKARAFGKQGNHRECIRAVIEAEQLFNAAEVEDHPDTRHEAFKTYYTGKLLSSDLAQGLFDLTFASGIELAHTVARLQSARHLSNENARSRLLATAQLAALHLRHGDIDEGIAFGDTVIVAAQGTRSARVTHDIRRIYQLTAAPRTKQVRAAAELRGKAHELLRHL